LYTQTQYKFTKKGSLGFKQVKQRTLLGIALLISMLISLPRILRLYDIVEKLGDSFGLASISDISVRAIFLFLFSCVILQFNCNWKFLYANLNKYLQAIITVLINAMLFFIVVLLFMYAHQKATNVLMSSSDVGLAYFVYFMLLVILVFIARVLRFQMTRQDDIAEKELLKQQSLQNELSALKNQINPHFLFNSLNSLNSLIRDNKEATVFVNKLSFMYRYILQSGQQDFVTLKEELKFLESYVYLIKTRYRDRFSIQIDIDSHFLNESLPALALQLLVENAVKHNEISESNPLLVKLYIENDYLVVENPIRPRTTFVDSTGQGLANIDKRYLLLKQKHISISDINGIFKVKLPIK
jgi:two-component system LytT family sensor kinase